MLQASYPDLDDLLEMMGEAGKRLLEIGASEEAAGNISVCARWSIELRTHFPLIEFLPLVEKEAPNRLEFFAENPRSRMLY